jgi:superfamily II DNA or RNA helicase
MKNMKNRSFKTSSTKSKKEEKVDCEFPKTLNTSLGQKGYSVLKSELSEKEQENLKKILVVKPVTLGSQMYGGQGNEPGFPIFRESDKKIYMPRYFGEKEFGIAKTVKLPEGDDIDVPFNGGLRDIQIPVVKTYLDHVRKSDNGGGLLELPCAAGKCLGKDTPVLMYDGSIKMVQDIVVGDVLMGDDSTPRNVYSLTRGREQMYRIEKYTGEGYIVNESHILSLKKWDDPRGETVDISVKDYLKLPGGIEYGGRHGLMGYHVPVEFIEKEIERDPYEMGVLFGNSHKKNKRIPMKYKCNSTEIRQAVLSGILDSYTFKKEEENSIEYLIEHRNTLFNDDVIFLARSLGYYVTEYTKKGHQFRPISIVPSQTLTYTFYVKPLSEDDYYGFEIDGNRRFVLGDFTVTHNTVISINIITQLKKKTLVIVNKEFLLNQWLERIRDFAPSARLGKIQGNIIDIEDKDIVIGMLQSISMKDYPPETYESFGLTIFDEVHHISSEVFSCALFKIVTKYMLGLSATMERKDGTTYVFKMFLGDIVYKGSNEEQHAVCVRALEYVTNDTLFNEVETDFRGNPQYSKMIVKLCDFGPRSDFIIKVVQDLLVENPHNQIMIIAHNRSLLTYLYNALEHRGITNIGYYVGGMKQAALDESSTKQIVLSSYSMAAEALDIKTLSTMVMVTPKTDIIQCIGRILRVRHSQPIVVDIVDKHDLFQNQWLKRRAYYKKCNYRIRMTDSRQYKNMMDFEGWRTVFEPKENKEIFAPKECGKCLIDLNSFDE